MRRFPSLLGGRFELLLRGGMLCHKISPDLEMRLLQPEDAGNLFALIDSNRADLREWLPWIDAMVRVADATAFIARALHDRAMTRAFTCGIYSSGRLVGAIGHNHIDWSKRVSNPGWWLVPAAQGKGIMTSCCRAVFAHAFAQLEVSRIVVGVATENVRGQAIVQRLGFTQVSTLRNAEWLRGRRVDHYVYSLSAPSAGPAAASLPAPNEMFTAKPG